MPTSSLKTRPEVVALRWAWVWLVSSVIGLVLGLALVLTFNHLIVVPFVHQGRVIDTDCYITRIQIVTFDQANCTPVQPGIAMGKISCRQGLPLGPIPEFCASISVLYHVIDGQIAKGTLHPDYQDNALYPNNTLKCRCERCHPEAGLDTLTAARNVTPAGDQPDNGDLQEVTVEGKHLQVGSKTRCYYRKIGPRDLYLWNSGGLPVIHAVLWPTMLFIAGFVGLFFSCISLQKSSYLIKLNKRMTSSV